MNMHWSEGAKDCKAMRIISLEEAFLHPKLRELYPASYVRLLDLVKGPLTDVGPERIRRMDAAGIDLQVLSHVQPGVQTLESSAAIRLSREVNDWLGGVVQKYPTRFAGFAMLPTQSPMEAADELERTVAQLGFKGAMINGHTNGRYLDDDSFSPILERAQALDVPIYIHPTDPPQAILDTYYKGLPAMMQSWGWQVETGTHLLRLISSGVFDRFPALKIIVRHMGELIPLASSGSIPLSPWETGFLPASRRVPVRQRARVCKKAFSTTCVRTSSLQQAAFSIMQL
jgi:predicted TIM-barrel fold metal-dependent hydrolase